MTSQRRKILHFLRQHTLCTISTVNLKTLQPESALIAYAELETLEILFITLKGSRKYINILKNNKVALVIGWKQERKNWATLQYEGRAYPATQENEIKYKKVFANKKNTPCTGYFLEKPGMLFFKITPTWVGFSNYRRKTPQVIEIKFPISTSK